MKVMEEEGISILHLDVMDGAFVPSISFGMPVLKSLRPCTEAVFDVHMMVEDPQIRGGHEGLRRGHYHGPCRSLHPS